jgi:hypothetical protein
MREEPPIRSALTIQSRGTIIVPIMVPLSQALGAKIHSKNISVFCADRVNGWCQNFQRNFARLQPATPRVDVASMLRPSAVASRCPEH